MMSRRSVWRCVCASVPMFLAAVAMSGFARGGVDAVKPLIEKETVNVVSVDLTKLDLLKDVSQMAKVFAGVLRSCELPQIVAAQAEPLLKTMLMPMASPYNQPLQDLKKKGGVRELFFLHTPSDETIPHFVAIAVTNQTPEQVEEMRLTLKGWGYEVNFERHGFVFGIPVAQPGAMPGMPGMPMIGGASGMGSAAANEPVDEETKKAVKLHAATRFRELATYTSNEVEASLTALDDFAAYPIRGVAVNIHRTDGAAELPDDLVTMGIDLEAFKKLLDDGMVSLGFGVDIKGMRFLAEAKMKDAASAQQVSTTVNEMLQQFRDSSAEPAADNPVALMALLPPGMLDLMTPKLSDNRLTVTIDPPTLVANPQLVQSLATGMLSTLGVGSGGGLPPMPPGAQRGSRPAASTSAPALLEVGKPFSLKGVTVDGKRFDWSAYKGKIVLIDFWASWCGPCIGEVPHMIEAYEKFKSAGFEIVSVGIGDNNENLKNGMAQHNMSWVSLSEDLTAQAAPAAPKLGKYYGISGIPRMLLVGRDGRIQIADPQRIRGGALLQTLEQIFAEESGAEESGAEESGAEESDAVAIGSGRLDAEEMRGC